MTIKDAIETSRFGEVKRKKWNETFLRFNLTNGSSVIQNVHAQIGVMWHPLLADLIAEDWETVR